MSYNPSLKTNSFNSLSRLLHDSISARSNSTSYKFLPSQDEEHLTLTLETKLDFYPFMWEFFLERLSPAEHTEIIRDHLVSPLISLVNSQENKYQALLK